MFPDELVRTVAALYTIATAGLNGLRGGLNRLVAADSSTEGEKAMVPTPQEAVRDLESQGLDVVNDHNPAWPLTVEANCRADVRRSVAGEYHITNSLETADGPPHYYDLEPV